jgi:ribonucleoside-triphosphate reductase (thioredoxin)
LSLQPFYFVVLEEIYYTLEYRDSIFGVPRTEKFKQEGEIFGMKEIRFSEKFLGQYPDFPTHMNAIGTFVYLRTYSRYLPEKGRRETWKETVTRSVQYNVNLARKHIEEMNLPITHKELMEEAQEWFHAMFNLEQLLSGRTMWVGGAEGSVADKFPLGNFNCSFTTIEKWEDLADHFYLLLVGTGVGFKHTFKMAENIAPVRDNFVVTHKEYEDQYSLGVRQAETVVVPSKNPNKVTIYVGDSKEGWVDSLRQFFKFITLKEHENITEIEFVYDFVRPSGSRLHTFGGTASGHVPLMEMFSNFEKTIKNEIDPTLEPPKRLHDSYVQLRPIHVLDFGNFLGNNVVVGGVRRTAEIFLIDGMEDVESIFAKYGLNGFWDEEAFKRHEAIMEEADRLGIKVPDSARNVGIRKHGVSMEDFSVHQFDTEEEAKAFQEENGGHYMFPMNKGTELHHRRMSNNSVAFKKKPERKFLHFIYLMMKAEGEPAFINLEELARRRFKMLGIIPTREQLEDAMEKLGMNPCAEILLWTYGVCNLTTINVTAFVKNGKLDLDGLLNAQRRSARAGLRMTMVELELPHWSKRQQTDRLLGLSLTGWKDMVGQANLSRDEEKALLQMLKAVGREEADKYARKMRVTTPLLTTTVKPEGTGSQVLGGVSSGLHYAHSEYYIRRIRISTNDPLAKAVQEHKGWVVNPETGTEGATREEQMKNARTLVIDFPVYSGAKVTKDDVTVDEQFDTYFMFQDHYSEHNSSNTITIKNEEEWERAEERVWNGWDNFVGVSFLALDGGTYKLAPYEKCTKEEYEALKNKMQDFDMAILQEFEVGGLEDADLGSDCEGGICPVR